MMGRDEKKEEKRGFKKRERHREREIESGKKKTTNVVVIERGSQSGWGRSFFLFWCVFCVPE